MGTLAISGCATGMGAACRARLERAGHRVIGIDLRDSEVCADLSKPDERNRAVREVLEASGGVLDGLALCAGLGGHIGKPALVASVNYFGVVELLDGLFPALCNGTDPAALVIASNSAQLSETFGQSPLAEAFLAHDEAKARALADQAGGQPAYMISKNAVGRAVRRRAGEWGEAGVRLNAIAPGPVDTPLLREGLASPGDGDAIRAFKVPIGRHGRPEEVAQLMAYLLGPDAGFVHGAIWYIDGGADALVRPDRF